MAYTSTWETCEVINWLSNEESLYHETERIVEVAGSVAAAAEELEEQYRQQAIHLVGDSGLFNSLLVNGALGEVDWEEVARAFKPEEWGEADEAPEDDEEEDSE